MSNLSTEATQTLDQVLASKGPVTESAGNPNAPVAGGGFTFCATPGETNPADSRLNNTIDLVSDREPTVSAAWAKRIETDGTPYWVSPFERGTGRQEFKTLELCQAYMSTANVNQIEHAKLENKPAKDWSPQMLMRDPKRKLADFYDAATAARLQGAQDAARLVQPLIDTLSRNMLRPGRDQKLMHASPSEVLVMVKGLSDKALQAAYQDGNSMGKMPLARAARQEIERRAAVVKAAALIVPIPVQ